MNTTIYVSLAASLAGAAYLTLPPLQPGKSGSVLVNARNLRVEALPRNGYGCPDGLLWDRGALYLADEGAGLLRRWTKEGVSDLHPSSSKVVSPEDLVTDGRGTYYFTDDSTGSVWRYNEKAGLTEVAGRAQGLVSTEGIALAPDGTLYVGDGELHRIFSITPAGQVRTFLDGIRKPESLALDDQGGLYVADNEENKLYYVRDGETRIVLQDKDISPETILLTPSGLLITDSLHGRLYQMQPGSRPVVLASFGGVLKKIHGVTVDETGRIYVSIQTDLAHNKGHLFRLTPTGAAAN